MKIFNYTALDEKGKIQSGIIEATDEKQAASLLRERKLLITGLTKRKGLDLNKVFTQIRGVPVETKIMFTKQLSTMIGAGLPLSKALDILASQIGNLSMQEAIKEIIKDIDGGLDLSTSFEKHPEIFSKIYISLIRAGEASGKLDTILERLAKSMEQEHTFKSKTKGALIYPAMIALVMVGVMVVLFVFVIPRLSEVYEELELQLPLITKILVMVSKFVSNYFPFVLAGLAGFFMLFRWFSHTTKGRYYLADRTLKLPVFGKLSSEIQMASLARTLSLLVSSGLPILDALDITRETLGNIRYRDGIAKAAERVEKGSTLAKPLDENPVFPVILSQMVAVGEQTGKLDETLEHVADYFEKESLTKIENLSSALEPIIIIFLGVGVGFMMVALIMPIYGLIAEF